MKKNKNIKRGFAIAFASLLAALPLGLSVPKVESSAEAFGNNSLVELEMRDKEWINPLSFFNYNIRRPHDDWSGTLDNDSINTYSFTIPRTVPNMGFLDAVGVPNLNTVWNYLPLFSGNIHLDSNYSNPDYYYKIESRNFPVLMKDYTVEQVRQYPFIPTFMYTCTNVLIPLDCFKSLYYSFFTQAPANIVEVDVTFLQLQKVSSDSYEYKKFRFNADEMIIRSVDDYLFSSYMERAGLPMENLEQYIFHDSPNDLSVNVRALYVSHLAIRFGLAPAMDNFAGKIDNDFILSFYFSKDSNYGIPVDSLEYQNFLNCFQKAFTQVRHVTVSPADGIFLMVNDFFSMEIIPGFSFGILLVIGLAGLMLGFMLKMFLGG